MTGRPFRIAAAGLAMAFLWSALATLSHVRTGGDELVLKHRKRPADALLAKASASIRDSGPTPVHSVEQALLSTAPQAAGIPDAPGIEDRAAGQEFAPAIALEQTASPTQTALLETPPHSVGPTDQSIAAIPIVLGPALEESAEAPFGNSPPIISASQSRRRKEFIELPAPPDFDELDEQENPAPRVAALPAQPEPRREPDPVLLAELTSLRRDFDRLIHEQQVQRAHDAEQARRELLERQTQQSLADLRNSVQELRAEQLQRFAPEIVPTTPPVTLESPVSGEPPVSLSPVEPEGPAVTLPDSHSPPLDDPLPPRHPIAITESGAPGSYNFEIDGAQMHVVLAAIGEIGGWNIVASPEVQGAVTAVWRAVTPQQALDAVVRANGLAVRQQSGFLMVSTEKQSEATISAPRVTLVKLFRPLYVSGRDLLPLIEPLLTPEIGQVGVTLPQNSTEARLNAGGGDSLAQPDAVIVVDYPEVMEIVSRTIAAIDVPAPHVELEATILDVKLSGTVRSGVARVLKAGELCADSACLPLEAADVGSEICCQTSPKSCEQIIERLRGCTEVRVASTARLHVLNKQPAQLCVGDSFLWRLPTSRHFAREAVTAQTEDATRLYVRPFVAADDLIRLEVAPGSNVALPAQGGAVRQSFASVATNVAIPSGGSLVIAGLNIEQSLPAKSSLFKPWDRLRGKTRNQTIEQRELVIVISPRVIRTAPPETTVEPSRP